MELTLHGRPITKKNSQRIVSIGGRPRLIPSAQFKDYEKSCLFQIRMARIGEPRISSPVNVRCVYYMPTRHRVDLVNLLEASCDILVAAGILEDDNSNIVASHDGSYVTHDKYDPRVEITITPASVEV